MKSQLVASYGGVTDREKKHLVKKAFGIRGARAPGRRIVLAFMGRLAFGPSFLRVPEWRIDRAFLGRQAFRPSPIGLLCWAGWLGELGPGPWYSQMSIVRTNLIV